MEETSETRIKHLCYLIGAVFLSQKLTEEEKYDMIKLYAIKIENEADDKIARCHYGY